MDGERRFGTAGIARGFAWWQRLEKKKNEVDEIDGENGDSCGVHLNWNRPSFGGLALAVLRNETVFRFFKVE